jgi:hypothetical protein
MPEGDYQYAYRNKTVRDLAWVLNSPSLIIQNDQNEDIKILNKTWFQSHYKGFNTLLIDLDKDYGSLETYLADNSNRFLGTYFESLVAFWFEHSSIIDLLANNVQLYKNKRTIGEFDFLYRYKGHDEVHHLETAVKYYLYHNNKRGKTGLSDWIGPNPSDRLDKKYHKLVRKQCRLGMQEAGKEYLHELGIGSVIPEILIKGYLFRHIKAEKSASILEKNSVINPAHLGGWWCFNDELDLYTKRLSGIYRWIILPKRRWLSRECYVSHEKSNSTENILREINRHFTQNIHPLLLIQLKRVNDSTWTEISRGFVVPNEWPAISRKSL